jgi:hypothetical protein
MFREETRAARVTVVVVLVVAVCWSPYLASILMHTGEASYSCTQVRLHTHAHRLGFILMHTGKASYSCTQVRLHNHAHRLGFIITNTG